MWEWLRCVCLIVLYICFVDALISVNHSWVGRCGDDALFVTSWRLDVLALAQAKMGSRPKNLSRRF